MHHDGTSWKQLQQTVHQNASISRTLFNFTSRIIIAAYDSNGKVAHNEKHFSDLDKAAMLHENEDTSKYDNLSLRKNVSSNVVNVKRGWRPSLNSLSFSNKNIGGVDAIIEWSSLLTTSNSSESNIKYELEWNHSNDSIDIIGYLYTNNNTAIITLWPNSIYRINVRAFTGSSQDCIVHSEPLYVDTRQERASGSHPFILDCPGCVPVDYILALAIGVAAVGIVVAVAHVIAKACHVNRAVHVKSTSSLPEASRSTVKRKSFKKASVKKQLSSVASHIFQPHRDFMAIERDFLIEDGMAGFINEEQISSNDSVTANTQIL